MTLNLSQVDYSDAAKHRRAATLALGLLMLEEKQPKPGMLERVARMPTSELSAFLDRARNGDLPRVPFYNGERAICLPEEAPGAWDRPDRANKPKKRGTSDMTPAQLAQVELFSSPWQRELIGLMLTRDGVFSQEALRVMRSSGLLQPEDALKRLRATLKSFGIVCEHNRVFGHTWQYRIRGEAAKRMTAIIDSGWARPGAVS